MKTAVSIPDAIFRETDRLAKRTKRSRSQIVSNALAEYLARHSADQVMEHMNGALAQIDEESDSFARVAARKILNFEKW